MFKEYRLKFKFFIVEPNNKIGNNVSKHVKLLVFCINVVIVSINKEEVRTFLFLLRILNLEI